VAAALRDAGMEVIYTGLHQTPAQVVEAAVQEDVDVVALSILSGAHMTLFPEVLGLMRERGIADRLLTGGGIIPAEDMESLAKSGVGRLFGPGASTQDIARYIREWFVESTAKARSRPRRPRAATKARVAPLRLRGAEARSAAGRRRAAAKPARQAPGPGPGHGTRRRSGAQGKRSAAAQTRGSRRPQAPRGSPAP
jgi:methylmalonyl-CoA mutase C-terminal domain/subunit